MGCPAGGDVHEPLDRGGVLDSVQEVEQSVDLHADGGAADAVGAVGMLGWWVEDSGVDDRITPLDRAAHGHRHQQVAVQPLAGRPGRGRRSPAGVAIRTGSALLLRGPGPSEIVGDHGVPAVQQRAHDGRAGPARGTGHKHTHSGGGMTKSSSASLLRLIFATQK